MHNLIVKSSPQVGNTSDSLPLTRDVDSSAGRARVEWDTAHVFREGVPGATKMEAAPHCGVFPIPQSGVLFTEHLHAPAFGSNASPPRIRGSDDATFKTLPNLEPAEQIDTDRTAASSIIAGVVVSSIQKRNCSHPHSADDRRPSRSKLL